MEECKSESLRRFLDVGEASALHQASIRPWWDQDRFILLEEKSSKASGCGAVTKGEANGRVSGSPTFCSAADLVITTLNQVCLSHRERFGPAD